MISPQQLADAFALNSRLIHMQTEGLTHADSLIQTAYNINCLNWVVGHILVSRDRVLRLLGEEPVLNESERQRYETDSNPVRADGEDLLTLERQLELLAIGQGRIADGFGRLSPGQLDKEIEVNGRQVKLGARLFGLYFHDTYHTGQTDLLRQVAGKNDKIV